MPLGAGEVWTVSCCLLFERKSGRKGLYEVPLSYNTRNFEKRENYSICTSLMPLPGRVARRSPQPHRG